MSLFPGQGGQHCEFFAGGFERAEVIMDVTSRELICRPLAALRDNKVEAEKLERQKRSAARKLHYRPGVHAMMDWLADRLNKDLCSTYAESDDLAPRPLSRHFCFR
jgi:hypothetical protein